MSEFPVGTILLGHLIDFNALTPETQVTLERTPDSILLTLSWTDPHSVYARWFWREQNAPERAPGPPSRLLFQYDQGAILLVGCELSSARAGAWGPGVGVVSAKYALLDVVEDVDYEHINGLRSLIPGLRAWLGVTSVHMSLRGPNVAAPLAVSYLAEEGSPIIIGGPNNLRLAPTWRASPDRDNDSITLFDEVLCESMTAEIHGWSHFLSEHRAIRDLLLISSWTNQELSATAAFRLEVDVNEDGDFTESGSWRAVEPASPEGSREPESPAMHLIKFADLGPGGIRAWIDLRHQFARAIDPVVSSKLFQNPTIEVNLFLVAMGLEALGYLIALESGRSERSASDMRFSQRLELIAESLGEALPFDLNDWIAGTADAYNAVKHANREPVDIEILVLRWKQSVVVFRAWIALRLGISADELTKRLDA